MDRSDVAALVNLEQHVDAIHSFFTFIKVIPVVTEFRARPGSFSGTRLNYWRVRSYGWVYLPEGRMAITIYFHGYSYQSLKPMIAPASEGAHEPYDSDAPLHFLPDIILHEMDGP